MWLGVGCTMWVVGGGQEGAGGWGRWADAMCLASMCVREVTFPNHTQTIHKHCQSKLHILL
jgi:hypothetical protein